MPFKLALLLGEVAKEVPERISFISSIPLTTAPPPKACDEDEFCALDPADR